MLNQSRSTRSSDVISRWPSRSVSFIEKPFLDKPDQPAVAAAPNPDDGAVPTPEKPRVLGAATASFLLGLADRFRDAPALAPPASTETLSAL